MAARLKARAPMIRMLTAGAIAIVSAALAAAQGTTSAPKTVNGLQVTVKSVERSEEHTSELQSPCNLVCRLLLEKKKQRQRPVRGARQPGRRRTARRDRRRRAPRLRQLSPPSSQSARGRGRTRSARPPARRSAVQ